MKHIYLLRRHPPYGFNQEHLRAFEIVGVYATAKEAKSEADKKNANKNTSYSHTVQRLRLPEGSKQ